MSRSISKKRTHSLRNQKLSNDLLNGKVYYDWVITTAFYSAIHIVDDKVLPCDIRGINCKNINDVKKAYSINGRHAAREKLVQEKLDLRIAIKYKWLDDRSRYSRYTTFKVTSTEADKAKQYLAEVIKACS